uniref:Uncharacterized protein n=1 Tax=Molossus molossus TaxID=27622 RepID=A0A7J8FYX7_MOLMO|nr:hypothetical protein HJG59_008275 [Molossus molossus]
MCFNVRVYVELLAGSDRSQEGHMQKKESPCGGSTVQHQKYCNFWGRTGKGQLGHRNVCVRPGWSKWKRHGKHESLHKFRDQHLLEKGEAWKSLERTYTKRETGRRKALGFRVWLWSNQRHLGGWRQTQITIGLDKETS